MSQWNEAIETAARIAERFRAEQRAKADEWRSAAEREESIAGREVSIETAVGFAKRAAVSREITEAIRALARPAGDVEVGERDLLLNRSAVRGIICQIPNGDLASMLLKQIDALPIVSRDDQSTPPLAGKPGVCKHGVADDDICAKCFSDMTKAQFERTTETKR